MQKFRTVITKIFLDASIEFLQELELTEKFSASKSNAKASSIPNCLVRCKCDKKKH